MNNKVYTGSGTYGFKCWTCGGIFDRMWGTKCNACRRQDEMHAEYVERLTALFPSTQFKRSIIKHCQTCGKPFQYCPVEGECLCKTII